MKLFGKELNPFSYSLDGKGVKKEPEGPKNLKNFFKHFKNKFSRLISVNIFIIIGNFPLFFGLYALSGNLNYHGMAPTNSLFAPLYGIANHNATPLMSALGGVYGAQAETSLPSTLTYVFLALSGLVIFTFGFVNVGTTYILRNMVKGEPIFMWSDFWYAIKRNVRQALIMGVLDVILTGLCIYDIVFFNLNTGSFQAMNIMFFASLLITLIWLWMRFYIYILMVTFDLSIFKIIKNALIFSVLGFKRNFMATLGIVAMLFLTWGLMSVFLPLGIAVPFILLFGDCAFMACYAAFPKIKEVMIDPYYAEEVKEIEEPIFHDMG